MNEVTNNGQIQNYKQVKDFYLIAIAEKMWYTKVVQVKTGK